MRKECAGIYVYVGGENGEQEFDALKVDLYVTEYAIYAHLIMPMDRRVCEQRCLKQPASHCLGSAIAQFPSMIKAAEKKGCVTCCSMIIKLRYRGMHNSLFNIDIMKQQRD